MAQSSDHGRRTKPSLHQTVYTGTFIHSTSLTDLEVLENTIVGVNGNGIIEFLEQGMQEADVQDMVEEKYGWKGMEIVKGDIAGRGFWFPGFVGKIGILLIYLSLYRAFSNLTSLVFAVMSRRAIIVFSIMCPPVTGIERLNSSHSMCLPTLTASLLWSL